MTAPHLSQAKLLRAAIRDLLEQGPASEAEIVTMLNGPTRSQVRGALRILVSRDVVANAHDGVGGVQSSYRLWADVAGELRGRPRVVAHAFSDVPGHRGSVVA